MVDYRPNHSEGSVAAAPRKEEKNMTLTELENELDMIANQMDAVKRMLDITSIEEQAQEARND